MFKLSLILLSLFFLSASVVFARVTPEDIINQQLQVYHQKLATYSPQDQQKLSDLSDELVLINKQRTDQLAQIMDKQAAILDEYEKRSGHDAKGLEKARYQVTFAHEAVAYQAAKVYVYDLSSEKNLKSDAQSLVNLFKSDLNSTRSKVIYSQQVLEGLVKNAN